MKSQDFKIPRLPIRLGVLAWMALSCAILSPRVAAHDAHETDDRATITAIIKKTWETPASLITVDPVVVSEDYAIADWVQGARGGRALLKKAAAGWTVTLCSGDAIRSEQALKEAGLPDAVSRALAASLAAAEAKLDPAYLAKLSTFEGTISVEDGANHTPHHKQH